MGYNISRESLASRPVSLRNMCVCHPPKSECWQVQTIGIHMKIEVQNMLHCLANQTQLDLKYIAINCCFPRETQSSVYWKAGQCVSAFIPQSGRLLARHWFRKLKPTGKMWMSTKRQLVYLLLLVIIVYIDCGMYINWGYLYPYIRLPFLSVFAFKQMFIVSVLKHSRVENDNQFCW